MPPTASELTSLGIETFDRGEYLGALDRFGEAISRARQEGQGEQELNALDWLCTSLFNTGEYRATVTANQRLRRRAEQLDSAEYQMRSLLGEAVTIERCDLRRRWPEVRSLLLAGLNIAHRLHDVYYEVCHLSRLGGYAVRAGDAEAGRAWLVEAGVKITRGVTKRDYLRYILHRYFSRCALGLGNVALGWTYAQFAQQAAIQFGNPNFVATSHLYLARAERARGRLQPALERVERALSGALQMHWRVDEQDAEQQRGELLCDLGRPAAAETAAQRALELAREMSMKEEEVRALLCLGRVRPGVGGHRSLTEALRLARERAYADHAAAAQRLLAGAAGRPAGPPH